MDLTRALDLSRNVFIQASAGAGKTWILAKRYAAILDDFARTQLSSATTPGPGNILVLTFTRKAAAEMSGRIYHDLYQLLDGKALAGLPDDFGATLRSLPTVAKQHIKAEFSQNTITTIDAFCVGVLREFASEAGLDPDFRLADEQETKRAQLETWYSLLGRLSRRRDPLLMELLEHLTPGQLRNVVEGILNRSEWLRGDVITLAQTSPGELVDEFFRNAHIPSPPGNLQIRLLRLADELPLQNLTRSGWLGEAFQQLGAFPGATPTSRPEAQLHLIHQLLTFTWNEDDYRRRFVVPRTLLAEDGDRKILRERLKDLVAEMEAWLPAERVPSLPNPWDLELIRLRPAVGRFAQSYLDDLARTAAEDNRLTFDQVIHRTAQLLREPAIAGRLQQRFPHILVDEFQDTNDLRWEIVARLADDGQGQLRQRGLFIVGDTKQSIYRFNNADVQVMNRVGRLIREDGGQTLDAVNSYRSSRAYLERVVNPLMTRLFPPAKARDDLPSHATYFEPAQFPRAGSTVPATLESTAYCLLQTAEHQPDACVDAWQAVKAIRALDAWAEKACLPEETGPAIGVLLRAFTNIGEYIQVFTQAGLPFEVVAGKELYSQQETFDLFHLISVLCNPLDDYALVGLLRSPVFACDDPSLARLRRQSRSRTPGWVWESLRAVEPDLAQEIEQWRSRSSREPLDRLLESILFGAERPLGWISETAGTKRLGNLRMLLDQVHRLSLEGRDLRQIYEALKFQIQHGDGSQVDLPGSARIQIMTIHGAKGLEFPMVVLPELQRSSPRNQSGFFCERRPGGDGWDFTHPLKGRRFPRVPNLHEGMKRRDLEAQDAEELRLFYVAVTRARYGIALLGTCGANGRVGDRNSWWQRFVLPGFGIDPVQGGDLDSRTESWQGDFAEQGLRYRHYRSLATLVETREPDLTPIRLDLPTRTRHRRYREISPHTIMEWLAPAPIVQGRTGEDEDEGATRGKLFGRLLHKALEEGWHRPEEYGSEILNFLSTEGYSAESGELISDLSTCLAKFRESKLGRQLTTLGKEDLHRELPVMGWMESDATCYRVAGIIDLLYRDAEGWVVLDYKSDRKLPDVDLREHPYWFQLQTYLWMVRQVFGIQARGALWFLRHEEQPRWIPAEPKPYFQKLSVLRDEQNFSPTQLQRDPDLGMDGIVPESFAGKPCLLVEPTRRNGVRLWRDLAAAGRLEPGWKITTLAELRREGARFRQVLTQTLARVGAASILGRDANWGLVAQWADAFLKVDAGHQFLPSHAERVERFRDWCRKHDIVWPNTVLHPPLGKEQRVLVHGAYTLNPLDWEFLRDTRKQVGHFHYVEGRQKLTEENILDGAWKNRQVEDVESGLHLIRVAYDTAQEADLAAAQLHKWHSGGIPWDTMAVAVSSMERYVPQLKRSLQDQDIPVHISKREPVLERPLIQLVLAYLHLGSHPHPSWEDWMAVCLHPLWPASHGAGLAKLDILVRQGALNFPFAEPGRKTIDDLGLGSSQAELQKLMDDLEKLRQSTSLVEKADDLMECLEQRWDLDVREGELSGSPADLRQFQQLRRGVRECVQEVRESWREARVHPQGLDLGRELRVLLRGREIPSGEQQVGVEVLSYLESMNTPARALIIMGLTEDQFPIDPESNPLLLPRDEPPWYMNRRMFQNWLQRPVEHTAFLSAFRGADGSALQPSTFLEGMTRKLVHETPGHPASRMQAYQPCFDKIIENVGDSPWRHRHNSIVRGELAAFNGSLAEDRSKTPIQLSSSSLDELARCPQRYWLIRELGLQAAEANILPDFDPIVGTFLHHWLEQFGKREGFPLVSGDWEAGLKLLERVSEEALKVFTRVREDGITRESAGELVENLYDAEQNLVTAMLQEERDLYRRFTESAFEKSFGLKEEDSWPPLLLEGEFRLELGGRIDRVFWNDSEVWAVDYKTGLVHFSDIRNRWSTQLPVYYLFLKEHFPEHRVVLQYERLRSWKNTEHGLTPTLGDVDADLKPYPAQGGRTPPVLIGKAGDPDAGELQEWLLELAQPVRRAEFPITGRPFKKACEYCPVERICRKTTLVRN